MFSVQAGPDVSRPDHPTGPYRDVSAFDYTDKIFNNGFHD